MLSIGSICLTIYVFHIFQNIYLTLLRQHTTLDIRNTKIVKELNNSSFIARENFEKAKFEHLYESKATKKHVTITTNLNEKDFWFTKTHCWPHIRWLDILSINSYSTSFPPNILFLWSPHPFACGWFVDDIQKTPWFNIKTNWPKSWIKAITA